MGDWPWLVAALAFALLCIGRTMAPAFESDSVIQDDARQHVFWMLRFREPELFRGDLIADYFQSIAPIGYSALYRALSWAVDPRLISKLVPPVLGCIAALFTYLLTRRLCSRPPAAFLATVLLSWYVWQYDDLASGSPRAFLLPTLAALLWALAAGRTALGGAVTAIGSTLYPVCGALGVAILATRLVRFSDAPGQRWRWRPQLAPRSDWLATLTAGLLVAGLLAPGALDPGRFGPTVSAEQARSMPEFGPGGRNALFVPDAYHYWIASYRTGLDLRVSDVLTPSIPILFELAALAAILPTLLAVGGRAAPRLGGQWSILLQTLVASFGLFVLAHLLLFRLYLPARYVQWSLPLVLAVSAGLGLGLLLDAIAARATPARATLSAGAAAVALAAALALYPARYDGNFVRDRHPEVTAYLREQPETVVVVGVPVEADSVPSLAGRKVLAAREYALAYHLGYYGELRRRLEDTADAYYADSPGRLAELAARYGADLFLVNRAAFDRSTFAESWAGEFEPFVSEISERLRRPQRFALLELADRCSVVDDGEVAVVPVGCVQGAR